MKSRSPFDAPGRPATGVVRTVDREHYAELLSTVQEACAQDRAGFVHEMSWMLVSWLRERARRLDVPFLEPVSDPDDVHDPSVALGIYRRLFMGEAPVQKARPKGVVREGYGWKMVVGNRPDPPKVSRGGRELRGPVEADFEAMPSDSHIELIPDKDGKLVVGLATISSRLAALKKKHEGKKRWAAWETPEGSIYIVRSV